MMACPPRWPDPVPSGWQRYHGNSSVFHCGYRGILENRIPTPDDPQNECFYDHSGALVDENHQYSGCRGTPNQYDSADSPVSHTVRDSGGILQAGAPAFITSRIYDINESIGAALRAAASVIDALGQAIALGILTARATVDPANWTFQGLPARSIRHLNVIGGILSSIAWNQNINTLLTNLTRRLDSFPIERLLDEIAQDTNRALRARNPSGPQVAPSAIGAMTVYQLVDWLQSQGIIQYVRPPEAIAREELNAASQRP
jgi:hypothetical protein